MCFCRRVKDILETDDDFRTTINKAGKATKKKLSSTLMFNYLKHLRGGVKSGYGQSTINIYWTLMKHINVKLWPVIDKYNSCSIDMLNALYTGATGLPALSQKEAEELWGEPLNYRNCMRLDCMYPSIFEDKMTLDQQIDIVDFNGLSFVVNGVKVPSGSKQEAKGAQFRTEPRQVVMYKDPSAPLTNYLKLLEHQRTANDEIKTMRDAEDKYLSATVEILTEKELQQLCRLATLAVPAATSSDAVKLRQ